KAIRARKERCMDYLGRQGDPALMCGLVGKVTRLGAAGQGELRVRAAAFPRLHPAHLAAGQQDAPQIEFPPEVRPQPPNPHCLEVCMSEFTHIQSGIEQPPTPSDPHAAEQLLPLLYEELRRLAAQKLAQEKPGHTLQATALVHEAYLRLVDGEREAP